MMRHSRKRPGSLRALLGDERGASLALVALALVVLVGMAALAVDMGMLYTARGQAQRTADASALAGAVQKYVLKGDDAEARSAAEAYGLKNDILGDPVVIQDADVTFPQADKIRVWVNRSRARGNGVPTIFAKILGISSADVIVKAAAQAFQAKGADCVMPILLPDRYDENTSGGADAPDQFNYNTDDVYVPWDPAKTVEENLAAGATGYSDRDFGVPITIRAFQNPGTANPSWYYPFRQPGLQGASDYKAGIEGEFCDGPNAEDFNYTVGDVVDTEPGAMIGPTTSGFQDLIDQSPNDAWSDAKQCVINATRDPSGACVGSPRIRPVPLFDPRPPVDPGVSQVQITGFAFLWVEDVTGNKITGRFVRTSQDVIAGAPLGDGSGGTLGVVLRLVE